MVSKAQVLSANKPDFRDIITRQASGVPVEERQGKREIRIKITHFMSVLTFLFL